MQYCSSCMVLSEGACKNCGNTQTRVAQPEDFVYLTTRDMLWCGAVEDALNENDIVFLKRGELGDGLGNRLGFAWERYHFFVACENLLRATELIMRVP